MLRSAALRLAQPVARVAAASRAAPQPQRLAAVTRTFATTAARGASADHHGEEHHEETTPVIQGPGTKPGEIGTDFEQATGLERFQLLGLIEGIDVFDQKPLDASRLGSLENPVLINSYDDHRQVGCTGSPADSHELIWLTVTKEKKNHRCPECGSVYVMDYKGDPDAHHH